MGLAVASQVITVSLAYACGSYVICSKKGQVLRRFPTLTQEKAEHFSSTMRQLSQKARSVVRDLDPP
eukprot:40293-Eustigmatos_ZCMA.PRE.1